MLHLRESFLQKQGLSLLKFLWDSKVNLPTTVFIWPLGKLYSALAFFLELWNILKSRPSTHYQNKEVLLYENWLLKINLTVWKFWCQGCDDMRSTTYIKKLTWCWYPQELITDPTMLSLTAEYPKEKTFDLRKGNFTQELSKSRYLGK